MLCLDVGGDLGSFKVLDGELGPGCAVSLVFLGKSLPKCRGVNLLASLGWLGCTLAAGLIRQKPGFNEK